MAPHRVSNWNHFSTIIGHLRGVSVCVRHTLSQSLEGSLLTQPFLSSHLISTKLFATKADLKIDFEKETVDDEERGGADIGGVKVEGFCFRARFLPKSDGGGGEGCAHSSQVVPRREEI